jgi:hypothetical protein
MPQLGTLHVVQRKNNMKVKSKEAVSEGVDSIRLALVSVSRLVLNRAVTKFWVP